jgi:hypothetical protein
VADPFWADVVLLALHENGADGTTAFADASNVSHTLTPVGNVQWDILQAPAGLSSSALFDGVGDKIDIAPHASFGFGTEDFTIEFYTRVDSVPAGNSVLVDCRIADDNEGAFNLYVSAGTSPNRLDAQRGTVTVVDASGALSQDAWHHTAFCRAGGNSRLFVDGAQVGVTVSDGANYGSVQSCYLGGARSDDYMIGWMAALRITHGTGRYDANFPPPTLPYELGVAGAVRAIVELLATAGIGGTGLQRLIYAVTFFGNDVPPMAELAEQKQNEIEVSLPNSFTNITLRAAIVAAVQARAAELGFTINAADILTLTGASA